MSSKLPNAVEKHKRLRKSASDRNIPFSLTVEDVEKLQSFWPVCVYTGVPFDSRDINNVQSFERVDNDRGYEMGNVIAVTKISNQLKSNLTIDMMRQQIDEWKSKRFNMLEQYNKDLISHVAKVSTEFSLLQIHGDARIERFKNVFTNLKATINNDCNAIFNAIQGADANSVKMATLEKVLECVESGRAKEEAEKLLPRPPAKTLLERLSENVKRISKARVGQNWPTTVLKSTSVPTATKFSLMKLIERAGLM